MRGWTSPSHRSTHPTPQHTSSPKKSPVRRSKAVRTEVLTTALSMQYFGLQLTMTFLAGVVLVFLGSQS